MSSIMRSYNSFTPAQRAKAGQYRKRMIAEGRIPPWPDLCRACGQTEGSMCYHTEDYSEPHGPHIVAFEICYACHMMIHCRHRSFDNWNAYADGCAAGNTYPAVHRYNFKEFASLYLRRAGIPEPIRNDGVSRRLLHEIAASVYNPNRNPAMARYAPDHIREACTGEPISAFK